MARLSAATLARRAVEAAETEAKAELLRVEREAAEEARKAEMAERAEFRGEDFLTRDLSANKDELRVQCILSTATYNVKASAKAVEALKADLDKSPGMALSWSLETFKAVARGEVGASLVDAVKRGVSLEDIQKHIASEVSRRAQSATSTSTSPTSNLWDTSLLEAWAEAGGSWYH
jgi:lipopolysaccharide biosynthesis regulator YciM